MHSTVATHVAPLAGAWIEMLMMEQVKQIAKVAPLAGAWIEIIRVSGTSRPASVAPLAGAGIEILLFCVLIKA